MPNWRYFSVIACITVSLCGASAARAGSSMSFPATETISNSAAMNLAAATPNHGAMNLAAAAPNSAAARSNRAAHPDPYSEYPDNDDDKTVTGTVLEDKSGSPIPGATIEIDGTYLWAITDSKGNFTIDLQDLESKEYTLKVSCLGYAPAALIIDSHGRPAANQSGRGNAGSGGTAALAAPWDNVIEIRLKEMSLALDEVVVTARHTSENASTSYNIGRTALDHLQMADVGNIAALLPGGKTVNPDLTTATAMSVREGSSTAGNSAFGTAVEVDGVRMGNNASFGEMTGADTRSVAVEDIESVEVITGVPSVEYGDINSGIVRIRTRKGATPVNVILSVNPRTYSAAISKGVSLGPKAGVLNISGEWARATQKLSSPYTSYSRRGVNLAYTNTFRKVLRFEAGFKGNIGGMNSKDDPDAYTGAYTRDRDNVFQFNTSLAWLLNRPGITNLTFEASANYNDKLSRDHAYTSNSSMQPSVHSEKKGYYLADQLPYSYFSDQIVDSKELDLAASLKYEWNWSHDRWISKLKAGVQYKATGNVGQGEYYEDPSLAPTGYRPRPYTDYPFMHNVALYAEENFTIPVGGTSLRLTAGVRMENVFVKGSEYRNKSTFSPRFSGRWEISKNFAIKGGWGVTEKLPSYYILYPEQTYKDVQTFGVSYGDNQSQYVYYTVPSTLQYNADLRWQRNHNSEFGFEARFWGIDLALTAFYNVTKYPYRYTNSYSPISYTMLSLPSGFTMPSDPAFNLDPSTGSLAIRDASGGTAWKQMEETVYNTFLESTKPDNGAPVYRAGVELTADFPEIKPIRTSFRLDASYNYNYNVDAGLTAIYSTLQTYTSDYVGIYATGSGTSVYNGSRSHTINANVTAITHIPRARIIITCRLEMSLMNHSIRLSEYNGSEYAYNVSDSDTAPTGGSIYNAHSYTAIRPIYYMDLSGEIHEYTDEAVAADPSLSGLIRKSGNAYVFSSDGYDPYFSANLSITKEIGDHVSLSFFANNFTRSRSYVTSYATGVSAIFTPDFYYGLTCRIKF